ncbi:unnamed protein product [Trifolium pratense]|uniref:Uncharacterized protein n=3 Tax=Trifolium pratense TaxID=57577 RepID=A0ACB0L9Q0_TRIPR|nr:unnamed protein product [Trifolium pratense]CAJ2651804.1 unnamed protein product [Trifolium pratense]CAJ2666187.1 unnamed protein product [Trifolium pratense]
MKWIDNRLVDSKEINIIYYQLCLLSYAQERLDAKISRLKARSDFCGANHHNDYCEEYCLKEKEREVINIDYNFQLKKILDEFLRSNQGSFDGFEVECGNLVEKANESEKLVKMEMKHHAIGEEEKLKDKNNGMRRVKSIDLYVTFESQQMEIRAKSLLQKKFQPSPRWESACSKSLVVGRWKHLLLYAKFMEFLTNKRKKKDDVFFLTYMPP